MTVLASTTEFSVSPTCLPLNSRRSGRLGRSYGVLRMRGNEVQVPLRGLDATVAQIGLDGVDVHTPQKPLGGPEVTEVVKASNPL